MNKFTALDNMSKYPKHAKCAKCDKTRNYTNPLARCYECRLKYCFDRVWGGQINNKMGENDEIRDICDQCRIKFKYQTI